MSAGPATATPGDHNPEQGEPVMRRIVASVLLSVAWLSFSDLVRAELNPARKGVSIRDTVQNRLCYAGRFRFERGDRQTNLYHARCLEQMPSCEGHPNAAKLDEVSVVLLGNEDFKPEVGSTYCLILTAGSKRGMTVEAHGPEDAATAKQMKEIIESPSAFENDATWRARRALWAKFCKDLGPDERPLLYGEDDGFRYILYVKGAPSLSAQGGQFPLHLYDKATGKTEPIIHAKVIPGMNRITFSDGQFQVWFNGSVELSIGVPRGK
jgi:hypothetical protein